MAANRCGVRPGDGRPEGKLLARSARSLKKIKTIRYER